MAERRSLLFHSAVYVVGQLVSKAFGFIVLLVYARFLVPEDFGITGTLGAYSQILSTCLQLGLSGAVFKHYFDHRDDPAELRSYLSSVFLFQALVAATVVGLLDAFGGPAWRHFTNGAIPFHPYVRITLWVTFLGALTAIPQAVFQAQERSATVVGLQMLQGIAVVTVGVALVALLRQHALGVLRTQLASAVLLALVFTTLFVRSWSSRRLRWRHVRSALRFGLPLLPHGIGTILMQTVDRMMLEKYVALDEVGQYSIAMTLGMILGMLGGGINQAWSPHFFRTMREEPESEARGKARTFAALFTALFTVLALVGGLFAGELVGFFLGARYVPAVPYLLPFIIGNLIAVYYYLPANQLFLAGRTGWFLVATGAATAVSIGLNLWYLPRGGGAIAAAWIFVAGTAIQTGVTLACGLRFGAFPLLRWRHAIVFAATVTALVVLGPGAPRWSRLGALGALLALVYALLVRGHLGAIIPGRPSPQARS